MGLVFVAEQTAPVRRQVALKVCKPGMDTKEVMARFEAERQALALMDHPNIAKVFDAGTTDSGRPYFVMELVRGIPITEYCEKAKLGTRERLKLFITVCQAVQHAHLKGIIHRDIKPSNVMVTLHDGVPVPKVIDFGVAKALNQRLTEQTVYTQYQQLIGTPLYMSPEQAEFSGLDIDTRTDVYSLGVLLYELLTGTTPFDKQTLTEKGIDEFRRLLREDDPPRPSARISTLDAAQQSTLALQWGLDPRRLSHSLKGELDWIVMKALEKDRNRRYESASDFAADVQRYLHYEPIIAKPPTLAQRLIKLAIRHSAIAWTTVAILLVIAVAFSISTVVIVSAYQKERAARESATASKELAEQRLESAERARKRAQDNFRTSLQTIDVIAELSGRAPDPSQAIPTFALRFFNHFAHRDAYTDDDLVERGMALVHRAELNRKMRLDDTAIRHAYADAFACFEEAGALSELSTAEKLFGEYVYSVGHVSDARSLYHKAELHSQEAVDIDPNDVEATIQRCNLLTRGIFDDLRNPTAGLALAERAVRVAKNQRDSARARFNLCRILISLFEPSLRDPFRAVQLGKEATDITPLSPGYWGAYGAAHYRCGNFTEAVEALERSKELRSNLAPHESLYLSMAHWELGHQETSKEVFRDAAQSMQTNHQVHYAKELELLHREAAALLEILVDKP